MAEKNFIIDFDSTFTQVEALDVLADISLQNHPEKEDRKQAIHNITEQGMNGTLDLRESLNKRIALLDTKKEDLDELIKRLQQKVSKSVVRNKEFFEKYADNIFIVSNGFKEFITPIVSEYGVKPENVYANEFKFDENGKVVGYNPHNVLSQNNGKVAQLKELNLKGDVYVIGDGYTDYEIKKAGLANKFYAFTENVERDLIKEKADHITPSLDEFLYLNKMNTTISYPKNRIKVLLLENVHQHAIQLMKEEGLSVEEFPAGLDEDELIEKIKDVSVLGIRSKTQITKKVLDNAKRLISIGAFCIGTNQIDLEEATKKGVAVFNAPFSNTRSVVELAIANMIMLMRNLPDKMQGMHEGKWLKSADKSFEVRGKKLGIIGYGNIGTQLSVLAEGLGMDVYYYDVQEKLALGNATKVGSLQTLLKLSDIISLHVDGRPENKNMIGKEELETMRKGSILVNMSRGHIIEVESLAQAIKDGHINGAAVDVFPEEPKSNKDPFNSALRGLPNVILTPHIGGSTLEAQENIADFVPNKIMEYINTGGTGTSVNFPNIQLPELRDAHRLIHIHHNVPGVMAKINNCLAEHEINIVGQYLQTNSLIGYVITDIDKMYDRDVIKALRKVEHTIRFRVLY